MQWNIRGVESDAPDRSFILCGLCLSRYKHAREFCPICYELYSDEVENIATSVQEENKVENGQSENEQGPLKDPNKMVCL